MPDASTVAAVDLGSNSFHLIVARLHRRQLRIVDRLREPVRLAEGLTQDQTLRPDVRRRALACLARFGQRLRGLPPTAVRAVGTSAMRQIADGGAFLHAARHALNHTIDIISGQEEARLIYRGVAHGLSDNGRRLVIDIGGGSTELIIGRQLTPERYDSLDIGCVNITRLAFADGIISAAALQRAKLHCALAIRPIKRLYQSPHWQTALGSSGAVRSIAKVLQAQGWSKAGISAAGLNALLHALAQQGHTDQLDFAGLSDERRPVFAGGVAVLSALFEALNIERLHVSDAALREGLLYELSGHGHDHDIREHTVQSLAERFAADQPQAQRVENTALALHRQTRGPWRLDDPEDARLLRWACRLHEIGLSLSHHAFHKHGAYILNHADLPGFSRQQQTRLALLVRNHRRKFNPALFNDALADDSTQTTQRLCLLLRLAVLLHRGRADDEPQLTLAANGNRLTVTLSDAWRRRHPLTHAELANEAHYLQSAGYQLLFY